MDVIKYVECVVFLNFLFVCVSFCVMVLCVGELWLLLYFKEFRVVWNNGFVFCFFGKFRLCLYCK